MERGEEGVRVRPVTVRDMWCMSLHTGAWIQGHGRCRRCRGAVEVEVGRERDVLEEWARGMGESAREGVV